jgi:hypothetical protein
MNRHEINQLVNLPDNQIEGTVAAPTQSPAVPLVAQQLGRLRHPLLEGLKARGSEYHFLSQHAVPTMEAAS